MSRLSLAALLIVALSLCLAAPKPRAAPKKEILDVVPANANMAFGIRSINDLCKKGDGFWKRAKLNPKRQPSDLVRFACALLGANDGFDEDAPTVLFAVGKHDLSSYGIYALPFTNLDRMAGNYGFRKAEVVP